MSFFYCLHREVSSSFLKSLGILFISEKTGAERRGGGRCQPGAGRVPLARVLGQLQGRGQMRLRGAPFARPKGLDAGSSERREAQDGKAAPTGGGEGAAVASRGLVLAVSVRPGESHVIRRQPSSSSSSSWLHCEACGILGPRPGIELVSSAREVRSLDLQMARGVPTGILLNEPSFLGEEAGRVSVKASIVLPPVLTWSPSPQDLRP